MESGEEGTRRKSHHGDQEPSHRGEHSMEEDRRRKERPGSSASHHRSPPPPTEKQKSQREREGVASAHEQHKRRKEDELKTISELGHKRKRDHLDEGSHLHEAKRSRHGDRPSSRDRDADHHHDTNGSKDLHDKKWRQELEVGSGRKNQHSRTERDKGKLGASKTQKHTSSGSGSNRDNAKKTTPTQDKEHARVSESRSRGLDWAAVTKYTEKANSRLKYQRPMAVLEKFTPGAVFAASLEISPSLAGAERYQTICKLVRSHFKEKREDCIPDFWSGVLQTSESNSPQQKGGLDWDKSVAQSLGPCRRALTASDDYVVRRLLRKEQQAEVSSLCLHGNLALLALCC